MASKTQKKTSAASEQPAPVVKIDEAVKAVEAAEEVKKTSAASPEEVELTAAPEEVAEDAPAVELKRSEQLRATYLAQYGQPIEGLVKRHALAQLRPVGVWLAEWKTVDPAIDVGFPVLLDGVPQTLDQVVTLLSANGATDLGELLSSTMRRYNEARIARAIIFSLAIAKVELAEDEEG